MKRGFTPSVSDDGDTWRGDPARRIDPTRYERVVAAMKLVRRLKPDKRHSERNYPYVSKAALQPSWECRRRCARLRNPELPIRLRSSRRR